MKLLLVYYVQTTVAIFLRKMLASPSLSHLTLVPSPPLPPPFQLSSRILSDSSVLLRQKTCQLMAAAACVQVARSAKQEGEKVREVL